MCRTAGICFWGNKSMKITSKCPKCGNTDILMVPGNTGVYGGNNIMVGLTTFSAVLVNRYVCCECGYSEEWIDKEDIPTLKKTFYLKGKL